jgi:hypothetical protein
MKPILFKNVEFIGWQVIKDIINEIENKYKPNEYESKCKIDSDFDKILLDVLLLKD